MRYKTVMLLLGAELLICVCFIAACYISRPTPPKATSAQEISESANTPLSQDIANGFTGTVKAYFAEHDGLAGMVVATVSADGGVHVMTAARDPNLIPSRLLDKAMREMRAIHDSVDTQKRSSEHLQPKPAFDL